MDTTAIRLADLSTIDDFRRVVALERAIWGFTDAGDIVTVPVFIITTKRGAILIGAFDDDRLIGFSYSIAGMKDRQPMQWSHMTGVLPDYRGGLGYRLKLAQRERALARGYDLVEWTFDPLQALNAHFNLEKLGAVAEEYVVNFYGESTSALHKGTPTDRLVAGWRIAEPRVADRIQQTRDRSARPDEEGDAPVVNPTVAEGAWRVAPHVDLGRTDRRLRVEIPTGFTDMQQRDAALALRWRLQVRDLFQAYLGRGYRAAGFALRRDQGWGRYLLARE